MLHVYNLRNLSVELVILLPKSEGWLAIHNLHNAALRRERKYEICLRTYKHQKFYILDTETYPYLKLTDQINLQKESKITSYSLVNRSYILNYNHEDNSQREIAIDVIERATQQPLFRMDIKAADKIYIINTRYNSMDIPVLLKLSEGKLSLMSDWKNRRFN